MSLYTVTANVDSQASKGIWLSNKVWKDRKEVEKIKSEIARDNPKAEVYIHEIESESELGSILNRYVLQMMTMGD